MCEKTFQEEKNDILKFILDEKFFSKFTEDKLDFQRDTGINIELYITSVCNQKCSYCYLTKYGDELYPKEIRNWDMIFKNMRIFLDYLLERKFVIQDIDLFSGEIWGMKQGNKILDILLEYKEKGLDFRKIMIPSNVSFLTNKNTTRVVQNYINKFRKFGVYLAFSASLDGPLIESKTRSYKDEKSNDKRNDEFYENVMKFCTKNGFGFHPMISAESVEQWPENFDWWMDYLGRNRLDTRQYIMFLEVRNDYWTKDKIISYLKFIDHVFDWELENIFGGDKESMIRHYFLPGPELKNYEILSLCPTPNYPNCTIGRGICVRLGDLAICPCHRTSYPHLLYGKFTVENDKIVGVEANNIQLANKILLTSTRCTLKCDQCAYNEFCLRGCHGSQFEATKDPMLPIESVCDLFMAKFNFLIYKWEKIGAFDFIKDQEIISAFQKRILDGVKKIKNGGQYPYGN